MIYAPPALRIGRARLIDELGTLAVDIDGHRFDAGEKYTVLETGWAVYIAWDPLPPEWFKEHGEVRPADDCWNELASHGGMLMTTHPVLVALSLRAWWHRNHRPIPSAPEVPVPSFDDAVQEVRQREILNDFNKRWAGLVPGLMRWHPAGR